MVFDEGMEEEALERQRETELTQFFGMHEANKRNGLPDRVLPTLRYVDMHKAYTRTKNKWVNNGVFLFLSHCLTLSLLMKLLVILHW